MRTLSLLATALIATPVFAATPQTFVTTYDAATYRSSGTITFNDHGYTGPTGVGANDFQVGAGFDANRIGQIQNVVTKDPDWITSDPYKSVLADGFGGGSYIRANMDAQVNFYQWAYTTVGGSTFSNMQIDKAGNYHVAKNDMAFQFYDTFQYKRVPVDPTKTTTVQSVDTFINFQPYAISDAKGWCGSVLTSGPTALERMAGQVTFDFAFDAYLNDGNASTGPAATQIVPGFVMRSYGDYVVNITTSGGEIQSFSGSAVENNTNPLTGELDAAWQNQVSFLGGGVVPLGAWVLNAGTADVQVVEAGTAGATWHANQYAGYAFLLRADASRTVTFVALDGWSDYTALAVPEPSTYAMMAVGLGLVVGVARRRKRG